MKKGPPSKKILRERQRRQDRVIASMAGKVKRIALSSASRKG